MDRFNVRNHTEGEQTGLKKYCFVNYLQRNENKMRQTTHVLPHITNFKQIQT